MKVQLIRYTADPDWLVGFAAAHCTHSTEDELTVSEINKAFKHSLASGHDSVAEHAVFTFAIEGVSRALLAQLTRHRIASFTVQSQRYVDMGVMETICPDSILENEKAKELFTKTLQNIGATYRTLVDEFHIPKEDARYITPQGATTSLVVTMNARELRHFFSLRCCNRAQWEIRQMADEMLKQCKEVAPKLFENVGPNCVTDKCHEARPCKQGPRTELKEQAHD